MPPKISKRSDIPAFRVMDVMTAAAALEAQGRHIIHMEVGEPGTPTPERVIDAAERTMRAGRGGYTVALGITPLRERIARHYGEAYGADVDPKRVIVTTGSSAAFTLAFTACFDSLRPKKNMQTAPKAGNSGINQMWSRKYIAISR